LTLPQGDGDADAETYVRLVCMYALLVGGCSIALAVLNMGQVAKAIPKSVMSGFKVSP
jgi:MFS superfamily sulfate permease-like transporter